MRRADGNCGYSPQIDAALMVACQSPTTLAKFNEKVAMDIVTLTFSAIAPEANVGKVA